MLGEMSIYAHIFVLCFFREGFCYADVCSGAGNWLFYDRQCYSCIADAVSWPTARTSCQQLGADLVTISNAGTQSFLEKRCPDQDHWIGLNDIYNESYFTWVGDSTIILKESYINWRENEPNDRNGEDCVVIDRWYQYKWNDLSCSDNRSYICQKPQLQSGPQAPLNFTVSSYGTNYVNLTWISSFNGGYEQFFILSLSEASNWKVIGNITDPGEGKLAHFDPGYLTPGQEYRFRLKSCNVVNCSVYAEFKVTNKALQEELLGGYAIMAISVLSLLLGSTWLIVAAFIFYKKRHGNLHQSNTRDTQGIRLETQTFTKNYENAQFTDNARDMYTELGNPYQGNPNTTYEELKM